MASLGSVARKTPAPGSHRWSVAFGVWWGVPVRLHLLLLLFAAVAVGLMLDGSVASGLLTVVVLVLSVAVHEAAHCLAAVRLGGRVEGVVLSPIGGLQTPKVPNEPEPQLVVALAGPLTNFLAVITTATGLLAAGVDPGNLLSLFNPVSPRAILEGPPLVVAAKQTVWINWTLLLLNLLPAYPFDGGPALRAALWPLLGRRTAVVSAAYTALGVAALLSVVAVLMHTNDPQAAPPLWAPLVILAVFLFVSAQRDLAALTSEPPSGAPPTRRRQPAKAAAAESVWLDEGDEMVLVETATDHLHDQRREADEAYEDARVDDILARLYSIGFDKLSAEDRAVLQRASHRYRSRHRDGADTGR